MGNEAKKQTRAIPLAEVIAEEAEDTAKQFSRDDEFNPDRDLGHGPTYFAQSQQNRGEIVIDKLLMSVPQNQGYYLKLYREIMPGQWEFKEQIMEYDTWSDMELEVSKIVKANTMKYGAKKWGSGVYRIVIWRTGGIREADKYPPYNFPIDAGDQVDINDNPHTGKIDAHQAMNENMNTMTGMLNAVKGMMPQPVDPNVQFQAIVQAFLAGKGENKDANNTTMQLMMTMMTALVQGLLNKQGNPNPEQPFEQRLTLMTAMLKDLGLLGGPSAQPKTFAEQIADLKLLGLDPFKKEDMIEQVAKFKALMGTVGELNPQNGKVERPGILEKLIDALAPHVPKMIADLKSVTDNAALVQRIQAVKTAETQPRQPERPTTSYGQPVGPEPNRMGHADVTSPEPDYDPYSGFKSRPFERPKEDAGVGLFGSGDFASTEQRAAHFKGQDISPQPQASPPIEKAEPNLSLHQAEKIGKEVKAADQLFELPPLLQQLEVLAKQNMADAYPALYMTLAQFAESKAMLEGIRAGLVSVNSMVEELRAIGGPVYNDAQFVPLLHKYLDGFKAWILEYENGAVKAVCGMCNAVHDFESKAHFVYGGDGICGATNELGIACDGKLSLVEDAQNGVAKA